jgi:hypothetical protein
MEDFQRLSPDDVARYARFVWLQRLWLRRHLQAAADFAAAELVERRLAHLRSIPHFDKIPFPIRAGRTRPLLQKQADALKTAMRATIEARTLAREKKALRDSLLLPGPGTPS